MNAHLSWRAVPGKNADKKTPLLIFFISVHLRLSASPKNKVSGNPVNNSFEIRPFVKVAFTKKNINAKL